MFNRYAIYFTLPPGELARRGAAWLGWDVRTGTEAPHPDMPGVDVAKITQTPRKYGLHGTIKAPFVLASGKTEKSLCDALSEFCCGQEPFNLGGLTLSRIGPFLALVPSGNAAPLNRLADQVVQTLDPWRAPMDDAEVIRKTKAGLSDQQRHYLNVWGYPHVMEFFQFHITMTGPLKPDDADTVTPLLQNYFEGALPAPFPIDSLTLCGEKVDGRFIEVERFALGKAANGL